MSINNINHKVRVIMYHPLSVELTEAQVKRALSGKAITIKASQLGKGRLHVHPANKKKIEKAALRNKSAVVNLSFGELADTARHHIDNDMDGSGFCSKIWEKIKKGWKVLKDTGIPSRIVDAAVPMLAQYAGDPSLAPGAREGIRQMTGVGVKKTDDDRLKAMGLYLS